MKVISGVLLCFLISSCNINSNQHDIVLKKDGVIVKHVGKNLGNEAEYHITASCDTQDRSYEQISLIPDNQKVEIFIDTTCNNKVLEKKVLDTLTQKKIHTVLWYRDTPDDSTQLYLFQNTEIQKIANAPWKYLELEGLTDEQYLILRNTHNPVRQGFGMGTRDKIYSQNERDTCEALFQGIKSSQDEQLWEETRKKVESCYRKFSFSPASDKDSPLPISYEIWNKDTTFTHCSSSDVPENLEKAVSKLSNSSYSGGIWGMAHFGRFVTEYCITPNGDMIFYSQDKAPATFGRYDSTQDIIEPASFNPHFLSFIYFFDGKKYGFGKRIETTIPLISGRMEYKHFEKSFLRSPFQNEKNEKFCKNGLTSAGKPSECFMEIYYEYDFMKNIISEKKVCIYWKNTMNNIVPMEKCMLAK